MTEWGGTRVGRYRLVRRLGSGAMGSVWLAEDETLGIQVAIKQVDIARDQAAEDRGERISRARSEARNAVQLRGHPHVANVLDIVDHEGLPWIVMEYVTGAADLRAVIGEQGRLAEADVARVGSAMLKALGAGHALGIVHRDVKPANILLAPDHSGNRYGRVMLTDYGISLYADSGQTRMTNGVIGTPGYLAPERADGAEPPASDLFSLGATLYCAVEGHGPFDRDHPAAAIAAALTEEPPRPVHASARLADVIMALLARQPGQRPTVHNALAELAEVEAAARAAESSGAAETSRALRPSRRTSALAAAGVLAALVAGTWTAVALTGSSDGREPGGQGTPTSSPSSTDGSAPTGVDTPTRSAPPGVVDGSAAGLTKPLKAGDCVIVGTHDEEYTTLTDVVVVGCHETETSPTPTGQVIATVPDTGEAAVRSECEKRTAQLRGTLADPVLTVLRPGDTGPAEAACLVFQRDIKAGGPLGSYRDTKHPLYLSQMGVGDCFDVVDDERFLVDCRKPHHEQVIGYVEVPSEISREAVDANALCISRFERSWVRTDRQEIASRFNDDDWDAGFQFVTCSLAGVKETRLPGGAATPKE